MRTKNFKFFDFSHFKLPELAEYFNPFNKLLGKGENAMSRDFQFLKIQKIQS